MAETRARDLADLGGESGNLVTLDQLQLAIPAGVVTPFAGSAAPTGWLLCAGQEVSRTTYADLFTVLGTQFGAGDGSTTFLLPDMRGRTAIAPDNMGGTDAGRLDWNDALGTTGGEQDHRILATELPSHTHGFTEASTQGINGTSYPAPYKYGTGANYQNVKRSDATGYFPFASTSAHPLGGTSVWDNANVMQPSIVLNYIIKH